MLTVSITVTIYENVSVSDIRNIFTVIYLLSNDHSLCAILYIVIKNNR